LTSSTAQALDRQSYAFGMLFNVDGPTPASNLLVSDIFMNIDMDLCDMSAIQNYDLEESTTLSKKRTGDSAGSKISEEKKIDSMQNPVFGQQLVDLNQTLVDLKNRMDVLEIKDSDRDLQDIEDCVPRHLLVTPTPSEKERSSKYINLELEENKYPSYVNPGNYKTKPGPPSVKSSSNK